MADWRKGAHPWPVLLTVMSNGRCVGSVIQTRCEKQAAVPSALTIACFTRKEECTPSKPKQFDSTTRVYRVPDRRDGRVCAYNEAWGISKASLSRRVNFVPCDRPIEHDRERPSNGEGGKGGGEQERGKCSERRKLSAE